MNILKTQQTEKSIEFILKNNVHKAKGVDLIDHTKKLELLN